MLRFYAFLFATLFYPSTTAMGRVKIKLLTNAEVQEKNQDALEVIEQEKKGHIRQYLAEEMHWGPYVTQPEIFLKGLEHMGRFEKRDIQHCRDRIAGIQEQIAALDA